MTKFSDVLAAGVTIRESANDGSDFSNPTADYRRLFLGEDGLLHVKDSAGTVTSPYTGGSADTRLIVAVASQHDITSTTATEVTLTPTPTLAAGTYSFTVNLLLRTANATNGPRIGINHTGTATFYATFHYEGTGVTAATGSMATPGGVPFGHIHESGSAASFTTTTPNMGPDGITNINTTAQAIIQGVMVVTVSGDFEIWHGCESGATQTSVMVNSSVTIVKIA